MCAECCFPFLFGKFSQFGKFWLIRSFLINFSAAPYTHITSPASDQQPFYIKSFANCKFTNTQTNKYTNIEYTHKYTSARYQKYTKKLLSIVQHTDTFRDRKMVHGLHLFLNKALRDCKFL